MKSSRSPKPSRSPNPLFGGSFGVLAINASMIFGWMYVGVLALRLPEVIPILFALWYSAFAGGYQLGKFYQWFHPDQDPRE